MVEGNVNQIKMLKRQLYGRASFALLRKRVILHPSNTEHGIGARARNTGQIQISGAPSRWLRQPLARRCRTLRSAPPARL